jgi:hypothetical protein
LGREGADEGIIALLGLVAYPGQGIYKSTRAAIKSRTRKEIMKARHTEGIYLFEQLSKEDESMLVGKILSGFDTFGRSS